MLWHTGDMIDAVNKVKDSQKHLFVFIRDGNTCEKYVEMIEKSTKLHEILRDSISLNLMRDSAEYRQFADVYGVEETPSIHVITHEGKLVKIINGVMEENALCDALRSVFGVNLEISNESQLSSKINESTNEAEEAKLEEDKMVEVRRLLAEKHKQKEELEKQKEKEDELKRRELGRKLHQLKKTQKEREEEDIKAEVRRKRNEEKEARDKILRQIEEDKLERRQRFNNQTPSPANNQPEETQVINRNCTNGSEVRLQFRFPDGSSINHKFQNEDKFAFVREFVSEYIRNTMGSHENFEIKQFFPRRTISTEDDDNSLLKLQLVPSASFAVSFINRPVNSHQTSVSNWLISPINFFYLSLLSVLKWIKLKLGITPRNPPNEPSPSTASNWEERQRRLLATESRTIKKDGNLAGFKDSYKKIDDDEDEARWNGNSTQQM